MQVTPVSARPSRASWRAEWHGNQPAESDKGTGREGIHDLPESDAACMHAGCAGRRVGRISDRPGSLNKVAGVRRGLGRGVGAPRGKRHKGCCFSALPLPKPQQRQCSLHACTEGGAVKKASDVPPGKRIHIYNRRKMAPCGYSTNPSIIRTGSRGEYEIMQYSAVWAKELSGA